MNKDFLMFIKSVMPEVEQFADTCVGQLDKDEITCAAVSQSGIFFRDKGRGVGGLLKLYDDREIATGNVVIVDKIIGLAAAMIVTLIGATVVYGGVMSKAGKEYLEKKGVKVFFGILVDRINNRAGDGMCPVEASVTDISDARKGLAAIRKTIAKLREAAERGGQV